MASFSAAEIVGLGLFQFFMTEKPHITGIPRQNHRLFTGHRLQSRSGYADEEIAGGDNFIDTVRRPVMITALRPMESFIDDARCFSDSSIVPPPAIIC